MAAISSLLAGMILSIETPFAFDDFHDPKYRRTKGEKSSCFPGFLGSSVGIAQNVAHVVWVRWEMADTFARVELHERWAGDKPDYDALHANMNEAGFERYMYEGSKKVKLPTGMYRSSSQYSLLLLKSKVGFAATKTGHKTEGIIWRGEEIMTWGLEIVPTMAAPVPPTSFYTALAAIGMTAPPSRGTLLTPPPLAPRPPQRLSSLLSTTPDLYPNLTRLGTLRLAGRK
jgi:hypothetical protein